VSIDLRCQTSGAAKINWESLRSLYGAFKFDITDRVRKEAKVLPDRIQIASANLPSGKCDLRSNEAAKHPQGGLGALRLRTPGPWA